MSFLEKIKKNKSKNTESPKKDGKFTFFRSKELEQFNEIYNEDFIKKYSPMFGAENMNKNLRAFEKVFESYTDDDRKLCIESIRDETPDVCLREIMTAGEEARKDSIEWRAEQNGGFENYAKMLEEELKTQKKEYSSNKNKKEKEDEDNSFFSFYVSKNEETKEEKEENNSFQEGIF